MFYIRAVLSPALKDGPRPSMALRVVLSTSAATWEDMNYEVKRRYGSFHRMSYRYVDRSHEQTLSKGSDTQSRR